MATFTTTIIHPISETLVDVEVGYEMRDRGVFMKENEDVQPVIMNVRIIGSDEQLLDEIGECTLGTLSTMAELDNRREREFYEETFRPDVEDES